MGTTQGWIWLKAPSEVQIADLRTRLGTIDWVPCPQDWRVATVRHYEEIAAYLAWRTWTTALGWVEDSDLAALQMTSRRLGPVFLPVSDFDPEDPVLPITGRVPIVAGMDNVLRWCEQAGLCADEHAVSGALARKETFAEDQLDAVVAALGLPPAPPPYAPLDGRSPATAGPRPCAVLRCDATIASGCGAWSGRARARDVHREP